MREQLTSQQKEKQMIQRIQAVKKQSHLNVAGISDLQLSIYREDHPSSHLNEESNLNLDKLESGEQSHLLMRKVVHDKQKREQEIMKNLEKLA